MVIPARTIVIPAFAGMTRVVRQGRLTGLFFADEIVARRGVDDGPVERFFGHVYELFSDFGRSILRPVWRWLGGWVLFSVVYLLRSLPVQLGKGVTPIICVDGTGNPLSEALTISLKNAMLFIGWDRTDRLKRAFACLYGSQPLYEGSARKAPVIPIDVAFTALLQNILSLALLFLFALALRNHFKVK